MIRWKSVIPFGLGVDQHRVYDRGDTCVHHVIEGRKGVDETYQKFVVVYEERSELAVLKRELFAPAERLADKGAPSSCPSAARQLSMGLLHAPLPPAASMRLPYNLNDHFPLPLQPWPTQRTLLALSKINGNARRMKT
jgi:hypothetical protein